MKVIIAGGSGFMGSHFVQYMAGKYPENRIINLDIYEDKQKLRSMEDMANYQFMRWNLTNREAVFHLLDTVKPDIIINFAQEQRDPCGMDSYAEKSETAAINLLDACRTCGIRRYHHVSSEKIYGTRPPYHTPHIFTEESPIAVSDAFSPVMTDADLTARMYHRFDGLPVTIYPSFVSLNTLSFISFSGIGFGIFTTARVIVARTAPIISNISIELSGNIVYKTAARAGLAIVAAELNVCAYPAYLVSCPLGTIEGVVAWREGE